MAYELSALSSAFVADLESWFKMTFYASSPSVDFMDDTIIANTQTICAMLNSSEEENIEDIFDF
ncbi:MAG: hypothetical protein COA44_10080 [Arcobacter sp.]|nr:MAG: hypothetical protein COA44_10080 [Arcobacter sp.]